MKIKINPKDAARLRRKKHIRKFLRGSADRPRLVVHRSLNGISAQLVDDVTHKVLTGVSTQTPALKGDLPAAPGKIKAAERVGEALAAKAKAQGIERVVFDRNGYLYHGRVKAVAEGARKGGLNF